MKKLITIMMMILNGAISAQCNNDILRKCEYDKIESHGKYDATSIRVIISSKEKKIFLNDFKNNDSLQFNITDCFLNETTLIYDCIDIKSSSACIFIFGSNEFDYNLIITCAGKPWFKFKRNKE